MNVLLATTWNEPCGIAEHSAYLAEAVEAADLGIGVEPRREALNPAWVLEPGRALQILHLNYHRALHSRWTPEIVEQLVRQGVKVVITFHDTFGENPPDELSVRLAQAANAFIVHEPCYGLQEIPSVIYWRMGVPSWRSPYHFGEGSGATLGVFKGWRDQPVLGTVGFPFPWKNYERLCDVTREAGWALLLIAPGATAEQMANWRARQPDLCVIARFEPRAEVVSLLAGCDATAFCYTCANSGQSGAVLQGIAARKPVFALHTCRQNRALYLDDLGRAAICWSETFEQFRWQVMRTPIARVYAPSVALAEQDSWAKLGQKYAQLYRTLLA
jgi:hypothetical protein